MARDSFENPETVIVSDGHGITDLSKWKINGNTGNPYVFVANNALLFFDSTGQHAQFHERVSDILLPSSKELSTCWAKCFGKNLLGGVYEKLFDRASLCGRIRKHCMTDFELPVPSDVVGNRALAPDVNGFQAALVCLTQCLDLTGTFDIKTTIAFGGEGEISCNNREQSVEYRFKVSIQLIMEPGHFVLHKSKDDFSGSCGGPVGRSVWCSCCSF